MLGTYDKIIFTRPSVSVDEELGFLPGTLEEKMEPFMYSFLNNFEKIVGRELVETLKNEKGKNDKTVLIVFIIGHLFIFPQ